jgi:hypothetical protein
LRGQDRENAAPAIPPFVRRRQASEPAAKHESQAMNRRSVSAARPGLAMIAPAADADLARIFAIKRQPPLRRQGFVARRRV